MDASGEQRTRGSAVWRVWSAIPEDIARRLEEGGQVLEVGCGSGFECLAVGEHYPAVHVIGQDQDPVAIARARTLAVAAHLEARVHFEVSDSLRLPRASAEVIVAASAFARRDAPRLLNAIRNALVPEGVCLLVRASASDDRARALARAAGFSRLERLPGGASAVAFYELRR
jgi:cyclopropane fatty-acyl-phospholipid synthase-like methyltransferase